jgi:hypothetical protein
MWISLRRRFGEGDASWPKYVELVGLPQLTGICTIDSMLNEYVTGCGACEVHSSSEIREAIRVLPTPLTDREYCLLFLDAEAESLPHDVTGARLLGHDLSDRTHTSSLLNCGPWTGKLAQFTERLNEYGLLTFDDAVLAKSILPVAWPGDPHAEVTIWALFEVAPP